LWRILGKLVFIAKYRNNWLSFFSYLNAFCLARRTGYPIVGLSTQTPIPVSFAASIICPRNQWGQIIMYAGIKSGPNSVIIKPNISKALKKLLSKGCFLLVNSQTSADILKNCFPLYSTKIQHVFDLQYTPEIKFNPKKSLQGTEILLIGGDDIRRTPLWHLSVTNFTTPVQKLTVHFNAGSAADIHRTLEKLPFLRKIIVTTDYFSPEQFTNLFLTHKFSLVVYNTNFFAASSILLLSVAAGTPVLTSNFAFAKEISARYGKIGEMFEYGNIRDFQDKWEKLVSWKQNDWEEFNNVSRRVEQDCAYQHGLHNFLKILQLEEIL